MPASSDDFPLQIENAIVCEDVRAEVGGKHSIIGLYSGDIIVPEFENYLKIAVFIVLFARAAGDITLDATISYAGKDFIKLNAKLEYKDARDPGVLVTPSFPVELTGPGFIDVRAVCQGKEKRLLRKEVRQAPISASAFPPPTSQSPIFGQQKENQRAPRRPTRRRRADAP